MPPTIAGNPNREMILRLLGASTDKLPNSMPIDEILAKPQLDEQEKQYVKEIYESVSNLPERQIVSPELRVKVNDLILKNISKLHGIF